MAVLSKSDVSNKARWSLVVILCGYVLYFVVYVVLRHAAFDTAGELIVVREDVGRHNAVDKVVGALLAAGRLPARELGLMVSGRASFELTQKTLVAGMPLIAAVSAPSSLAVELAQEFNVTLVGFLRDDTFNVYAGKERIGQ